MNKMMLLALLSLFVIPTKNCLSFPDYPVKPVPFTDVSSTCGMWHDRQETNNMVTPPFALSQLEASRRLENFDLAADTLKRRAAGEITIKAEAPGLQAATQRVQVNTGNRASR